MTESNAKPEDGRKPTPPQAVILAAGQGSRLLPLTKELPKTLLKVNGCSILDYILNRVFDVGITDVIIVHGFRGEKIIRHVDEKYPDASVTYIFNPIFEKTNSTYSLWLTKDVIGKDIVVINADTLFGRGILEYLVDSDHDISLSIDDTMVGELPADNMKVTIVNGLLRDASKLIPPEKTHGDAIGIYRFKNRGIEILFSKLKELVDEDVLDQLFTFAVRSIMQKVDVHPVSTGGLSWIEIDDDNDLAKAAGVIEKILQEEKGYG